MHRFAVRAFGLLLAFSTCALAIPRSSSRSGAWDDADTWAPSGIPGNDDQVIVAPGHCVEIRRAGAAAAATSVLEGAELVLRPGAELLIGGGLHPSTGSNSLVVEGRVVIQYGARLVMDAEPDDQRRDRIFVADSGELHVVGREIARGEVTAEPAMALPGFADLQIKDEGALYREGELAGRYLMFLDGLATAQVYDILNNSESTIHLDQTSGAHGIGDQSPYTYSLGMVQCDGGNTVRADLTGGGDPFWDDIPPVGRCFASKMKLGDCFVGSDIEIGGAIHHLVGFVDEAGGGDRFVIRGSCPSTPSMPYVLRHWNSPSAEARGWTPPGQSNATMRVALLPRKGDRYVVYEPATITVPVASRSPVDDSRYTGMELAAGATLIMRYFD
jgi:hypothetical protein